VNKIKLAFVVVLGLLVPGYLLNYAYTLTKLLIPLMEVPIPQLMSELSLLKTGEIFLIGLSVITLPGALMVALASFIAAVRIWLD